MNDLDVERGADLRPAEPPNSEADFSRPSWSLVLTAALVGLIALAVATSESYLAGVVVASIIFMVVIYRRFFRGSRAFCLTLANLAAIYACAFLFFTESNFHSANREILSIGFVLPLLAFVAGSFRHRDTIMRVAVAGRLRGQRSIGRILGWLAPILVIGIAVSLLPLWTQRNTEDVVLLIAMATISTFIFFVSRDVAVFLLDTGLLFEQFFARMAGLIVPAFAFLTCYSLMVILFASIYLVLDHLGGGANFRVEGVVRAISFPESLYFSVVTLSTVGYGDIVPASSAVRILATAEIVCGILLLLFGFNEILSFARRRDDRGNVKREREPGEPS
jgi:voltage-gated potassium channel